MVKWWEVVGYQCVIMHGKPILYSRITSVHSRGGAPPTPMKMKPSGAFLLNAMYEVRMSWARMGGVVVVVVVNVRQGLRGRW